MGWFSCDYLMSDGGIFSSSYFCKLTMQKVESSTASSVCNTSKYTDCYVYKKQNSFWFLANAAYKALGLPEDDLKAFAAWKCRTLCSCSEGQAFIREYNVKGPLIVEAINRNPDCKSIYQKMYDESLVPCLELIRKGENSEAFYMYMAFYEKYKAIYLVDEEA